MIKKEYHHGDLKKEFIQIALDFIAKDDVDKLTLKILSGSTGTSRSAIYKHFKNKDALIEKIIEYGFEIFNDKMVAILKDDSITLVDKIYLTGKLYIDFAKINPNLYRLLFCKKYAHIGDEMMNNAHKKDSAFWELKKVVEYGQKENILRKNDSYKQTLVIWSSMHGFSSFIIDSFMDVSEIYEDIYIDMFETLLAGMVTSKDKLISTIPLLNRFLEPIRCE